MSKKICKIIIIIVVLFAIIIATMYLIDLDRMKKGEKVVFSTWGAKYAPVQKVNQNSNNSVNENHQKYSKTIDNITLELNIPNNWKYKEEPVDNDIYKYGLKLYKNNEEQYAMLYYYNNLFGVCGTERTSENITLNNGKEAIVGYYEGSEKWNDISFYSMNRNIAIINYKLINTEADELIEFIKTINITENNL